MYENTRKTKISGSFASVVYYMPVPDNIEHPTVRYIVPSKEQAGQQKNEMYLAQNLMS